MVELAQGVKLRGFALFVVLSNWKILRSLRLPQDDILGFNTLRSKLVQRYWG